MLQFLEGFSPTSYRINDYIKLLRQIRSAFFDSACKNVSHPDLFLDATLVSTAIIDLAHSMDIEYPRLELIHEKYKHLSPMTLMNSPVSGVKQTLYNLIKNPDYYNTRLRQTNQIPQNFTGGIIIAPLSSDYLVAKLLLQLGKFDEGTEVIAAAVDANSENVIFERHIAQPYIIFRDAITVQNTTYNQIMRAVGFSPVNPP